MIPSMSPSLFPPTRSEASGFRSAVVEQRRGRRGRPPRGDMPRASSTSRPKEARRAGRQGRRARRSDPRFRATLTRAGRVIAGRLGGSRKVRTPQGRTLGRPRRRKPTESGTESRPPAATSPETLTVRVKRWGKSPPASWRHGGSPNPVRCKANRLRSGGPPRSRVGRKERWSPSTESGLQACYGKAPATGLFYWLAFTGE